MPPASANLYLAYTRDLRGFCEMRRAKLLTRRSQPFLPSEEQVGQHSSTDHENQRRRITPSPLELRHDLEIHAVDRGDDRRRHEDDRQHREQLDDVVLREVDEAESRVEQELDLLRLEARILLKRLQVAQSGLGGLAHRLRRVRSASFRRQEQEEPLDLDEAFAQIRDLLVLATERVEGLGIDPAALALIALGAKHLACN